MRTFLADEITAENPMSVDEAIFRLKEINKEGHLILNDDIAIEMAISALEKLKTYEANVKIIAEMMQNEPSISS